MYSKFLTIIAICILGASLSKAGAGMSKEEAIKIFMDAIQECSTEVGATPADVEEVMKKQPHAAITGKCLRACLMKRYKIMNANGKFIQSVGLEHAKFWTDDDAGQMKVAQEVTDICVSAAVPDDHCEAAGIYFKCLKTEASARGIENEPW